jgi:WD40 repeat protein
MVMDLSRSNHRLRLGSAILGLFALLALTASSVSISHAGDKKKDSPKADQKGKKTSPLEELGKKLKEQIKATAPPAWSHRADVHGDSLPTGVVARLGTARFRHGSSITCVAYSRNGKLLATGGSDNKIRLFDPETGKEIRTLAGHRNSTFVLPAKPSLADFGSPTGSGGSVTTLEFSPDNKMLASGGWDDVVRLWDVETGKQIRTFSGHASNISAVTFSPDGQYLASRGGLDGIVTIWEAASGKELRRFEGFSRRSGALAFAPDGKTIVIGGAKAIYFKSVETGQESAQLPHPGTSCLAFSHDGKNLASGGNDSTLRIWDLTTKAELRQCALPKKEPVSRIAFSGDDKYLAAAIREVNAIIFDAATGNAVQLPDAVAFAPTGETVAFVGQPAAIRLWSAQTGKEKFQELSGHLAAVTHVVATTDGKRIVSGGDHLRVWDAATNKLLRQIPMPGRYVEALAVSPDGQIIVTGGRDKMVRLWDAAGGKEILQYRHPGTLRALAFSSDGKRLASGDLQLNVHVWDIETKKELYKKKLQATFTERLSLAFSPDGKTLAVGGALNADWPKGIPSTDPYGIVPILDKGYPILLWEANTGKDQGRLDGLYSRVRALVYSADGKMLAASSSDGRIVIWDVATGKERLSIMAHPENIDSVFRSSPSIAFGEGGLSLFSASTDRTLRVWDTTTGRERGRLSAPSPIYSMSVGKQGQTLVTGQADTAALVWDADFLSHSRHEEHVTSRSVISINVSTFRA